jgi:hypothetical protein
MSQRVSYFLYAEDLGECFFSMNGINVGECVGGRVRSLEHRDVEVVSFGKGCDLEN